MADFRRVALPVLWQVVMQGRNRFNFVPSLATFTPGMAKRATSVFAASPIVQGKRDASGIPDTLTYPRGTQIAENFYEAQDPYQGSVVLWITPEWDSTDGLVHYFHGPFGALAFAKQGNNKLFFRIGDASFDVLPTSWVSGTTYCVVIRWDMKTTLDGANYACISVNDVHTFGMSTQPNVYVPTSSNIGSSSGSYSASSIIQGLAIYRRPLFDGTYGVDVGNGDEINQIYNAGVGKDPTLITGSWDVTFCLPTNATAGALVTGTGEAWSHPHAGALLTDSYCQTTYVSSAWQTQGAPSVGPADQATADKVFAWGYKWTGAAAGDGVHQTKASLTAGADYRLRLIAHCTSANAIQLVVWDNIGGAAIATYNFGASSSRAAPGIAVISFQLPAGCTSIDVRVMATNAAQVVYFHQCTLYSNLWDDPGMEAGTAPTNEGTPTTSAQSVEQAHSGANSWKVVTDAADEGISRAISVTSGKYYLVSGWVYALTSGTVDLRVAGGVFQNGTTTALASAGNDAWKRLSAVIRATGATLTVKFLSKAAQTYYVDDVSVVLLTDVTLTVTPANLANSTEGVGVRVDGLDKLSQPLTQIAATRGHIRFPFTLRHLPADFVKFGNTAPVLFHAPGDAGNYIFLEESAANTIRLRFQGNGAGEQSGTWNAAGTLVVGTPYLGEIVWTASNMLFRMLSVNRITISQPVNLATLPTTGYFGSSSTPTQQADVVIG